MVGRQVEADEHDSPASQGGRVRERRHGARLTVPSATQVDDDPEVPIMQDALAAQTPNEPHDPPIGTMGTHRDDEQVRQRLLQASPASHRPSDRSVRQRPPRAPKARQRPPSQVAPAAHALFLWVLSQGAPTATAGRQISDSLHASPVLQRGVRLSG